MWSARIEMTCLETIAEQGQPIILIKSSRTTNPIEAALHIKRAVK